MNEEDILIESYPPAPTSGLRPGVGSVGIKATHKPTGIYEISLGERSQYANKRIALAKLEQALKLYEAKS